MEWISKDKELPPENTLIWIRTGGWLSKEELLNHDLANLIFIGIYEYENGFFEWKGVRASNFFIRASHTTINASRLSKLQPRYVKSWANIEESNPTLITRTVIIEKHINKFYRQEEIIQRVNKTYLIEKSNTYKDFIDLKIKVEIKNYG